MEDVQVSCYRTLTSLYALGTGKNIYVERYFSFKDGFLGESAGVHCPSSLLCRQLPALGQCLATLAGAMPVAFLEPLLNTYNPCSVFNTKSARERASESCGISFKEKRGLPGVSFLRSNQTGGFFFVCFRVNLQSSAYPARWRRCVPGCLVWTV